MARTEVADLDTTMNNFVSKQMCSKNCPCNALDNPEVIKQWMDMSETDLNKFGRTSKDYMDNMEPLVFSWIESEKKYSVFQDCINDIESGT